MDTVTALSQNDPRWKNVSLGFGNLSTIGTDGCFLTSLTMVSNCYGNQETPASLNEKMKSCGGFQNDLLIPGVLPRALPGMKVINEIRCPNTPPPLAEIDTFLASGSPVIVEVDFSPHPGLQTHFIVLTAKIDGDYSIADPWPYPSHDMTLVKNYGFGSLGPDQIIKYALFLSGPAGSTPKNNPSGGETSVVASFPVYAAVDALAVRSQPLQADYTLIKRIGQGTRLIVRESDDAANSKIGQVNQWLAVTDPADNTQGYVAAWYISKDATPPPPPVTPAPPPVVSPTGLTVQTIGDRVALRSQPVISDSSLIKRLATGTQLLVIEPPDGARAKIGVNGQWLQIRDPSDGTQGYVAAWYVAIVSPAAPSPAADGPAGTKQSPIVKTTAEGLALRRQPVINDSTLIKRLPINSELMVVEPADQALSKIGVNGQWLQVQDISGTQCYVAAWYVTLATGLSTIGVTPKSTNLSFGIPVEEEPSPLVLRTTVDNLALRSQPQITQATLLKRLRFGTDLLCLDSPQANGPKIGQSGAWLHVQDIEGTQGYVSAIYTVERPELNSGTSLAG